VESVNGTQGFMHCGATVFVALPPPLGSDDRRAFGERGPRLNAGVEELR
jgi:hypothetical protein